jgi:hypothetical protein
MLLQTKSILKNAWHWKTLLWGVVFFFFLSLARFFVDFTLTPIGGCVPDCDVYRKVGIFCANECPPDLNDTMVLVVFVVASYMLALAFVEWRSRVKATRDSSTQLS